MYFKQWLIKEMSHLVLKPTLQLVVDGKKVKGIDMHFENYPEEYKEHIPDWIFSFSAKIPNQDVYLIYKNGKTVLMPKNAVLNNLRTPSLFGERYVVPDFWWDYALVTFEDGTIKYPKVQ